MKTGYHVNKGTFNPHNGENLMCNHEKQEQQKYLETMQMAVLKIYSLKTYTILYTY